MTQHATKFVLILLCAFCLVLPACKKGAAGKEANATNPAHKAPTASVEKVAVPEQKQEQPDDASFDVDQQKLDARGASTELPADWPAGLALPAGASVTQAAAREGVQVVEFSTSGSYAETTAALSANAAASGYKVREAQIDKYSQQRLYSNDSMQLRTNVTDTDGKVFGSMELSALAAGQAYSGATQYTGEFELPAAWPSDILPIYEGCVLRELFVPFEKGGRLMLSAQSSDSEEAVIAWLEGELPKHGWTMGESQSRNGFSIRSLTGNGYTLTVSARTIDGLTDIQYEASSI